MGVGGSKAVCSILRQKKPSEAATCGGYGFLLPGLGATITKSEHDRLERLLMAISGHCEHGSLMSAFDPKRTFPIKQNKVQHWHSDKLGH